MIGEQLSDAQFYGLMLTFLALALAAAATVVVWPMEERGFDIPADRDERREQRAGDWWR